MDLRAKWLVLGKKIPEVDMQVVDNRRRYGSNCALY
jgi:hypothetical protein